MLLYLSFHNPVEENKKFGTCSGCLAVNCTQCKFCLDMKKYGGPGKLKMACQDKVCLLKSPPKRKRKNPVVTEHIAAKRKKMTPILDI